MYREPPSALKKESMLESDRNGFHSLIDLLDRLLSKPLPERWGPWKIDPVRRAIFYDGPHDYWLPLAQTNNSAEVLDWIVQLHEKSWATPEDIGNLVAALDDIFDLQNNICGCGIDHRIDAEAHVAKLLEAASDGGPGS